MAHVEFDDSDQDSSEDEFILNINLPKQPRTKIYFARKHPLVEFVEEDFQKRYRLSKAAVTDISQMLKARLEYLSNRNNPVPVVDQVLTAFRYYATGTFQSVISDLHGVHQTTCGRIVKRVTIALAEKSKDFISMPTSEDELRHAKLNFLNKHSFPNVVGVIDGKCSCFIYRNILLVLF